MSTAPFCDISEQPVVIIFILDNIFAQIQYREIEHIFLEDSLGTQIFRGLF
jgi:hypothetical protein